MIIITTRLHNKTQLIKQLQRNGAKILDYVAQKNKDLRHAQVSILLTTSVTIKKYNKKFRNLDKPTDVLSFPWCQEPLFMVPNNQKPMLGDIIIALNYVENYAITHALTLHDHLDTILIHGICHLLGYDHITDQDYEIMHKKETEIKNFLMRSNKK
jgi:probable rRNA maturation factor